MISYQEALQQFTKPVQQAKTVAKQVIQSQPVNAVKNVLGAAKKFNDKVYQQPREMIKDVGNATKETAQAWGKVPGGLVNAVQGKPITPIPDMSASGQRGMKIVSDTLLGGPISVSKVPKASLVGTAQQASTKVDEAIDVTKATVRTAQAQPGGLQAGFVKVADQVSQPKPQLKPKIGTQIMPETKLLTAGDPEQRLVEALQTNKGLRKTQEAMYTAERSKRIQKAVAAEQATGGGEAGFYAKKGQLSGQFDTVENTNDTLRSQVSQSDIDGLIDKISQSKSLSEFEKIPATQSLLNLLQQGKIPTESELAKLNMVFKPETIKAIIDNRSTMKKLYTNVVNVANLPREIMSSMDVSAPLRQGVFSASSHPKDFARSFKNMFGYTFSQKRFDNFYQEVQKRPTYQKMREYMQFTDMGSGLNSREEAFQSTLGEKIPILGRFIKGSNRGYTGFLNNFRADLFDTLYKAGEKMGKGEDEKFLRDLGNFINNATGRGNLKNIPVAGQSLSQAAPLLNATFFSPRLIASRVNLLNPVYYARLEPTVRKEAMKSLVAFVTAGMTILGTAKLAGAEVETDITSADFGKVRIGDTRYDIWGGFQPYVTFIARMILNRQKSTTTGGIYKYGEGYKPTTRKDVAYRFAEGKASPIASFALDAMVGKDFEGNEFDLKNPDPFTNPIMKRMLPLISQDLRDTIKEYGPLGPIVSLPGLFGIGSATYKKKTPKSSKFKIGPPPLR